MQTRSEKLNQHLKLKPKPYLYHYTTPNGLLGIINSNNLWATNIRFLNDFNEIVGAFKLAKIIISKKLDTLQNNQEEKDLLGIMLDQISTINGRYYVYVCSFSQDDDSLSQWRAYCPQTGGYALGISSNKLSALVSAQETKWNLVKCIYDVDDKKQIVEEIIESFLSEYGISLKKTENLEEEKKEKLKVDFSFEIAKIGGLLKDEAFKNENEWRLISSPIIDENKNIEFRVGTSCLVPYYNFSLKVKSDSKSFDTDDKSVRLIIGPTPHMDTQAKQAVEHILKREWGIKGIIHCSEIPYKGW